jgi:hypothetical protein
MLNNSNLITKSETAEVDTSILKISIIAFLGIAAAVSFSYFINIFLKETTINNFILAAAPALLFIVFFFLQSLYIKSIKLSSLIAFGEAIGLSLFFILNSYSSLLLIAIILSYLALYSALRRSKKEIQNQLRISVVKTARSSVPQIAVALSILLTLVYSKPFFPDNISISKDLIRKIIYPSEALIKIANNNLHFGLNNFSVNMNLPEIAKENDFPLPVLQKLMSDWHISINNNETILDAIYDYVNVKVSGLNQSVKWAVFGGLLLITFLSIKSIFWLFYWLIYIFIYLFYEILAALEFSKISYVQKSKETIVL